MIQTRLARPPVPTFTPVPRRAMSGGWTVRRQRDFIAALAATGSVAQAAAAVKMSKAGVYLLRTAAGAESFRAAWDSAIEDGVAVLKSVAFERAIDGVEVVHRKDGEVTHTTTQFDNRLMTRLLAIYDRPARAAARAAKAAAAANVPARDALIERFQMLSQRFAAEAAAEGESTTAEGESTTAEGESTTAKGEAGAAIAMAGAKAEFDTAMLRGGACAPGVVARRDGTVDVAAAHRGFGVPLAGSAARAEWRPPGSGPRVWSP